MKKTLVVYYSDSGYTRKNAEMIAEELGCEAAAVEAVTPQALAAADLVIYGGWLFASTCQGWKKFQRRPELAGKQLAVFVTGASEGTPEQVEQFVKANLTDGQKGQVPLFYIRGGFNYQKLSFVNKMLMLAMKKRLQNLAKKGELPEDGRLLLAAYASPVDFTARENVLPLCAWARAQ